MERERIKKSSPKKKRGKLAKKSKNLKILPFAVSLIVVVFLIWRVLLVVPFFKKTNFEGGKKSTNVVETKKSEGLKKSVKEKKQGEKKEESISDNVKKRVETKEREEKKFTPNVKGNDYIHSRYALVIDDVGNSIELLKEAIKVLPKTTTFAILPFLKYSKESADLLHQNGFHIILHSPMESIESDLNYKTDGIIKCGMNEKEVVRLLDMQLSYVPYAEGLNNHTGSKATKDAVLMKIVMRYLKKRKLYFLDSRTTPLTVAMKVAKEEGIPTMERRVFLDDSNDQRDIMMKIDEFILSGEKEERVVAIGHLRENTIYAISQRIPYWQKRGIQFVALSDIIKEEWDRKLEER